MNLESKQQIFIVVRRDRRVDLGLSVHLTREGADAAVAEFQSAYDGEGYTWLDENADDSKWVRYVSTREGDGPSVYIEVSEALE